MRLYLIWSGEQAAKLMAKIGFLVLTNMFKGQKMKIEDFLAAIAH